ncbi:MAG: hypothetical protein SPJ21_07260 [Prevotella sp.]|nr:hypothetical protein [Prevotella sp.]
MTNKYDDIIDLPHHVSTTHPQMSMHARAAQFAPFAALSGHHAAITQTERVVEEENVQQTTTDSDMFDFADQEQ